MIITLAVIVLLIVGIVLMSYGNKHWYKKGEIIWSIGMVLTVVTSVAIIFCSAAIIGTQINKEVSYQNALHEKEMLEYRIDNMESDIVGNEMLYDDIVEFNNSLRSIKKWANNPFTNWFYNKDVATIDYVEIKERF